MLGLSHRKTHMHAFLFDFKRVRARAIVTVRHWPGYGLEFHVPRVFLSWYSRSRSPVVIFTDTVGGTHRIWSAAKQQVKFIYKYRRKGCFCGYYFAGSPINRCLIYRALLNQNVERCQHNQRRWKPGGEARTDSVIELTQWSWLKTRWENKLCCEVIYICTK